MKFKESKKVINFLAYFLEEENVLVYRRHELSRKSLKNEILAICVFFCNALWFFTNFS